MLQRHVSRLVQFFANDIHVILNEVKSLSHASTAHTHPVNPVKKRSVPSDPGQADRIRCANAARDGSMSYEV
jgi:hypothetical protein